MAWMTFIHPAADVAKTAARPETWPSLPDHAGAAYPKEQGQEHVADQWLTWGTGEVRVPGHGKDGDGARAAASILACLHCVVAITLCPECGGRR